MSQLIKKEPSKLDYEWLNEVIQAKLSHPQLASHECIRLLHHELASIRCDKFGNHLAFYWHENTQPTKEDFKFFSKLTKDLNMQSHVLFPRFSKRLTPSWKRDDISWIVDEQDVSYEIRGNHGISPGLFLDQRKQRAWVRSTSAGKRVLNLFCYTGGFTLNAALGGAAEVLSIDSSASAIKWAQSNATLNNQGGRHLKFWKEDVRVALRRLHKRGRSFDIVICDAPSFSFGKKRAFSLQHELISLISSCTDVLAEDGSLLFSCNLEALSEKRLKDLIAREEPRLERNRDFKRTVDFKSSARSHLKSIEYRKFKPMLTI